MSSPLRPRRESRFTEGSYTTSSPTTLFPTTPSSHLSTILSEQDSYEARQRRRGNSSSSDDSLASSNTSNGGSSPVKESLPRRSVTFGRGSVDVRRSLDERPRGDVGLGLGMSGVGGVALKFKGRLRALTGERRKDVVKPYPGT